MDTVYDPSEKITNSYYLVDVADESDASQKTQEQFESGEVAYLLGQTNSGWGQDLGQAEQSPSYSNSNRVYYDAHHDVYGNTISVHYYIDGAVVDGSSLYDVAEGTVLTKPEDPVKVGYDFDGWFVDEEFTTQWDFNDGVTQSMILYAKFTTHNYLLNGEYYGTFASALENANSGDVITMNKDVEEQVALEVTKGKNVTLDLNGKKLSLADGVYGAVITVRRGAVLTVKDSAGGGVIDSTTDGAWAVIQLVNADDVDSDGAAEFILESGTLKGGNQDGCIIGSSQRDNTKITINGGVITGELFTMAIFHPQDGEVVINDGIIETGCGIEMRAGSLVMNGGKISVTCPLVTQNSNEDVTVGGVAIAISQQVSDLPVSVTVNGGTIISADGSVAFYQDRLIDTYSQSTNISAYLSANASITGEIVANESCYEIITMPNGAYALAHADAVAQIGSKSYYSLEEAYYYAVDGDEIVILNDIDLLMQVVIQKEITINLNGNNISLPDVSGYAIIAEKPLTVDGEGIVIINGLYGLGVADNGEGSLAIKNGAYAGINESGKTSLFGGPNVSVSGGLFTHAVSEEYWANGYFVIPAESGEYYYTVTVEDYRLIATEQVKACKDKYLVINRYKANCEMAMEQIVLDASAYFDTLYFIKSTALWLMSFELSVILLSS